MDPNQGRGRKRDGGISEEAPLKTDDEVDDDLRLAMGMVSRHGKKEPKRPTIRQRKIVEELTQAHGEDVEAMAKDHKRNKMQLSAGTLRHLIEACEYWPQGSGVDFRVPVKGLWTKGV